MGEVRRSRELWKGLTRPSVTALVVTLLVPAVAFGLFATAVTPDLIASKHHRYFACGPADTDLFLGARLAAVERARPSGPVAVLLGASAMKESFTRVESVEGIVAVASGLDVEVWDLAGLGQSLDASLAIVRRLPEEVRGVVVVAVTPFGLALGPAVRPRQENWKRIVEEDRAPEILGAAGEGNYFWSNREFFLPRLPCLAENLAGGPVIAEQHSFMQHAAPLPEPQWRDRAAVWSEVFEERYEEGVEASFEVLAELAAEARRRGAETVILESPISPRAVAEVVGAERWRHHEEGLAELARAHGMHYWDFSEAARLSTEDFYDLNHLYRLEPMQRHTSVLSRGIAALLSGEADSP